MMVVIVIGDGLGTSPANPTFNVPFPTLVEANAYIDRIPEAPNTVIVIKDESGQD